MFYAVVNGHKVSATPAASGYCSGCGARMIAKCGDVKCWHWAHVAGLDCDPWHEGETDWHLDWKSFFPAQNVEVCLGDHRGDVLFGSTIIEFQNSPISQTEIAEREEFYGRGHRLVWVFNAEKWHVSLRRKVKPGAGYEDLGVFDRAYSPYWESFSEQDELGGIQRGLRQTEAAFEPGPYRSFRWKWPHESLAAVSARQLWDFGDGTLLEVKKIHWNGTVGGWGHLFSKQEFLNLVLAQNPVRYARKPQAISGH